MQKYRWDAPDKIVPPTEGVWEWTGVGGYLRGEYGQAVCRLPDYDKGEGPSDIQVRYSNERLIRAAKELLLAAKVAYADLTAIDQNADSIAIRTLRKAISIAERGH